MSPDAFAGIFDGYCDPASGLSVRIDRPMRGIVGPLVKGVVERREEVVGRFEFKAQTNVRPWSAWLHEIELNEGIGTGSDFARKLVRHAEGQYRSHGVEFSLVHAIRQGCYVWARMGYRLREDKMSPPFALEPLRETEILRQWCERRRGLLASLVDSGLSSQELVGCLWDRLQPRSADAIRTPGELAVVGHDSPWVDGGRPMWLGKALLLDAEWGNEEDAWFGWKVP